MTVSVPTIELDSPFVEPGGQVTGRVELPGAEGVNPTVDRIREVRVLLRFRTEGRGDKDSWEGPAQSFPVGVDGALTGYFTLDVADDSPISYDGGLLRLIWEVEARTDLRLRIDKKATATVVVVPAGGLGLYRRPHPLS
jgi:hypothetical protein